MSTTVSSISTARECLINSGTPYYVANEVFLAESFQDIRHVVFSTLLVLVNVVAGLLVGIPGIEQLMRAIAALVSLFP